MGDLIAHGPACAFCSSARGPASRPARPPARPRINSEDHAGDEFTPTTEDVRLVYGSDSTGMLRGGLVAAFDRWLAAHDVEIREQALAPIRAALAGHPVCDVRPDGGIPSCGWKRAVADVRRALNEGGADRG